MRINFFFIFILSLIINPSIYPKEKLEPIKSLHLKKEEAKVLFKKFVYDFHSGDLIDSQAFKVFYESKEFIFISTNHVPPFKSDDPEEQCSVNIFDSKGAGLNTDTFPCENILSFSFFKRSSDNSFWYTVCTDYSIDINSPKGYCKLFVYSLKNNFFNEDYSLNEFLLKKRADNVSKVKNFFLEFWDSSK